MRRRGLLLATLVGLVFCARIVPAQAQAQAVVVINRQPEIKARYLYFLSQLVTPSNPQNNTAGKTRIAVVGQVDDKLMKEHTKAEFPPHDRNQFEWVHFPDLNAFGRQANANWNVVFVTEVPAAQVNEHLSAINELTANRPTLIVTEQSNTFSKLAAVNFYEDKVANRIKMQIRKKSLDERGLKAQPAFLKSDAVLAY